MTIAPVKNHPPETSEKNPTTSPSFSSRLSLECSPFTLTRSNFAFTGLHFMSFRTSPTVLPSGRSAQDRSSRMLLSQPRGGKILTLIRDHHHDTFHRTAFSAKPAADAVIICKFREKISVPSALSLSCQIESADRACLHADAAADAVFIMKIRCFFECHFTPPSICLCRGIRSSQEADVLFFHPIRTLSSAWRPVPRF